MKHPNISKLKSSIFAWPVYTMLYWDPCLCERGTRCMWSLPLTFRHFSVLNSSAFQVLDFQCQASFLKVRPKHFATSNNSPDLCHLLHMARLCHASPGKVPPSHSAHSVSRGRHTWIDQGRHTAVSLPSKPFLFPATHGASGCLSIKVRTAM